MKLLANIFALILPDVKPIQVIVILSLIFLFLKVINIIIKESARKIIAGLPGQFCISSHRLSTGSFANKAVILSLLSVLGTHRASAQTDWKRSVEKEGITVYTSIIPDSKIKAIKVECNLNATTSQLVAIIMDINTAPDWVYHVKSAKLIKQISPAELYYYSEVSLPWPTANRDLVAHLTVSQDPTTRVVTIDGPAVPGFVPVKKGIVRIDHSVGSWIITPLGPDKVHVEYTIHVDPGGALPAWLVNIFATDAPMKIFRKLKTQIQKPAYQNIVLAFVEN